MSDHLDIIPPKIMGSSVNDGYYRLLEDRLVNNYGPNPVWGIHILCVPSFEPEWALHIGKPVRKSDKRSLTAPRIILALPEKSLWETAYDGSINDAETVEVRYLESLPGGDVVYRITRLFNYFLLRARPVLQDRSYLDGFECYLKSSSTHHDSLFGMVAPHNCNGKKMSMLSDLIDQIKDNVLKEESLSWGSDAPLIENLKATLDLLQETIKNYPDPYTPPEVWLE